MKSTQKVLVFGATGHVGRRVVQRALSNGLEVVAFVRPSSDARFPEQENRSLFVGDIQDLQSVFRAIAMHKPDAVVSCIGPRSATDGPVIRDGLEHIISAMENHRISRLLAVAGAGILQDTEHGLGLYHPNFPPFLHNLAQQHLLAWELMDNSGLDYVCLCPPRLQPGSFDEQFETSLNYPVSERPYAATFEGCAACLISEIIHPAIHRQRVSIGSVNQSIS